MHIGDVAWGLRQHEGRVDEWKIRQWVDGGRTVAWSWLKQDGLDRLEHDVHPDHLHLLEPVGVRPEFRRRGLGAAVCAFALGRLYEEGGRQAIVDCISDRACELYKSLGFRIHATIVEYRRARDED